MKYCQKQQLKLSSKKMNLIPNQKSQQHYIQDYLPSSHLPAENKQNSQSSLLFHSSSFEFPYNHVTKPYYHDQYYTAKKQSGIRQSEYHRQKGSTQKNKKYCRFSMHAERIKSTNISLNESIEMQQQINPKMTFGKIKQSGILKQRKSQNLPSCFNHTNKQGNFFLLIADKEDEGESKLFYCEKCAVNLNKRGFTIHSVYEDTFQSPLFLQKLHEFMEKIERNKETLNSHSYLQQIQWRTVEIIQKYDKIIDVLEELKKQELLQIEKYKFEVFQYITKKEKQLQATLKKLQLMNQSYVKNCDFFQEKQNKIESQLYWNLLEQQKGNFHLNLGTQIRKIKLNEGKFLDQLQICEKLMEMLNQRMHELSFEEEYQEPGNNGLQIGLDATFGENNYQ